eukprot:1085892-Rhodomonas_salina.1
MDTGRVGVVRARLGLMRLPFVFESTLHVFGTVSSRREEGMREREGEEEREGGGMGEAGREKESEGGRGRERRRVREKDGERRGTM